MHEVHPIRAAAGGAPAWRQGPAITRGWQASALVLLCGGVAVAALPRAHDIGTPQPHQWAALAIAPFSAGGETGLRLNATDAVEPIDFAPDRPHVQLTMTLGPGETLRSLLARSGA